MATHNGPILNVPVRTQPSKIKPDITRKVQTCVEHRNRLAAEGRRPLTPEEERKLFPDEPDAWLIEIPPPSPPPDYTLSIVQSLASQFMAEADNNPRMALLLACAALHGAAKLVPTGMLRTGPPSSRTPKPPPPSI